MGLGPHLGSGGGEGWAPPAETPGLGSEPSAPLRAELVETALSFFQTPPPRSPPREEPGRLGMGKKLCGTCLPFFLCPHCSPAMLGRALAGPA